MISVNRFPGVVLSALMGIFLCIYAPALLGHSVGESATGTAHSSDRHSELSDLSPGPSLQKGDAQENTAVARTRRNKIEQLLENYSLSGDERLLAAARKIHKNTPKTARDFYFSAQIAQAGHNFPEAIGHAQRAVELQPYFAAGWMLLAALHSVQNEPAAARRACARLAAQVSPVVALACQLRARIHNLKENELRHGLESLERFYSLEISWPDNNKLEAWLFSVTGDLAFRMRDLERAEQYYRLSNEQFSSVQARAALADILIAKQDYESVLYLIDNAEQVPALSVRRMLAAKHTGRLAASQLAAADAVFQRWIADGDMTHAREMALFYSDTLVRPALALELAEKNILIQRELEDYHLLESTRTIAALGRRSQGTQ